MSKSIIKYYPNAQNKYVKHYALERPFIEPMPDGTIRVRQATELGYAVCRMGGVFDASYVSSPLRRARVQDGGNVSGCIMASTNTGYCLFFDHEI